VILEYEGKTVTALVFVGEVETKSIRINTEPEKVVYQVGEQLDLTLIYSSNLRKWKRRRN